MNQKKRRLDQEPETHEGEDNEAVSRQAEAREELQRFFEVCSQLINHNRFPDLVNAARIFTSATQPSPASTDSETSSTSASEETLSCADTESELSDTEE